jgi:hypothetical protein
MPNWNSNGVTINAPLSEVKKYLVYDEKNNTTMFNMHLLFPDVFDEKDLDGSEAWEYDWAVNNTGAKWFPNILIINEMDSDVTYL